MRPLFIFLFLLSALHASDNARAQAGGGNHRTSGHHGGQSLFIARVEPQAAGEAVARGTGAFILHRSRSAPRISFDLTYAATDAPSRVVLRNFAAGGVGEIVLELCGERTRECPRGGGALEGRWDGLTSRMVSELTSSRLYVSVEAASGVSGARGQLEPPGMMPPVRSFVARLTPAPGASRAGTGTVVFREIRLSGERTAVVYDATAINLSSRVQSAGLAILGDAQRFTVLPGEIEAALRNRVNAATVRGTFEVANATGAQLLASRFEGKPAFVIRTARFPRGELIGELQRVN